MDLWYIKESSCVFGPCNHLLFRIDGRCPGTEVNFDTSWSPVCKSTTDATFYSDSMNVLWWIDDMKKTFGRLWRIESVKLRCTVILFSGNMYQAHRILLI